MNQDNKILLIITAIPIAAILAIFMISKISFDLSLSPTERKLYNFNYENIPKIAEKASIQVSGFKSPIVISNHSSRAEFPETPLSELSPPSTPKDKTVSLILINKEKKMAIIDGKLLNIGDVIDNYRIAKIEKNRVLLKNREGERWLILE